jgi:nocturnin
VAIFYKREKLELLGMHVPFTPRDVKEPPIEERRDAGKCLVARFRLRGPMDARRGPGWKDYTCAKQDFIVASLHLASAKNEDGVKRRESQALCAMKEILTFKAMSGAGREDRLAPIIVAGDLNAQPHEPAVEVFKKLGLMSCYARHIRAEPLFTTWKIRSGPYKPGEAKMTIDYIFAQHSAFDVYDVLAMPRSDELGPKGLPCRGHPSDHLMLKACLEFVVPVGDP